MHLHGGAAQLFGQIDKHRHREEHTCRGTGDVANRELMCPLPLLVITLSPALASALVLPICVVYNWTCTKMYMCALVS